MDTERERRQRRRAFVLDHHPDRGGDPARFVQGLAAFDELHSDETVAADRPRVVVTPRRRWSVRLAGVLGPKRRSATPPRVR